MLRELDQSLQIACDLVRSLDGDDWTRASACDGWDVAEVVRHNTTGDLAFTVLLGGAPYDLAALKAQVDAVPLAGLAEARVDAAHGFRTAFAYSGADTYLTEPLGPMTATEIAALRASEAIVHSWDIAVGLGPDARARLLDVVDAGLAAALESASRNLMPRMPTDRSPFAPSKEAPDGAHPLESYVAYLGREV